MERDDYDEPGGAAWDGWPLACLGFAGRTAMWAGFWVVAIFMGVALPGDWQGQVLFGGMAVGFGGVLLFAFVAHDMGEMRQDRDRRREWERKLIEAARRGAS